MADLSRMAINQATTRMQHSLAEAVAAYAAQEVRGISVWRDKLDECGLSEAQRLLRGEGMRVSGLCRAGGFPHADAAGRQAAIDDTLAAIEDAAALNADCLIVVAGGLLELERPDADQPAFGVDETGAAPVGVRRRREQGFLENVFPVAGKLLAGDDAGGERVREAAGAGGWRGGHAGCGC